MLKHGRRKEWRQKCGQGKDEIEKKKSVKEGVGSRGAKIANNFMGERNNRAEGRKWTKSTRFLST